MVDEIDKALSGLGTTGGDSGTHDVSLAVS